MSVKGPEEANVDVKDNQNGTYSVKFRAQLSGMYAVDVRLENRPVRGSPFPVGASFSLNVFLYCYRSLFIYNSSVLSPSHRVDPQKCITGGAGLSSPLLGVPAMFFIEVVFLVLNQLISLIHLGQGRVWKSPGRVIGDTVPCYHRPAARRSLSLSFFLTCFP